MTIVERRAPWSVKKYVVRRVFRYKQRKYEPGDDFDVRRLGVPRYRLDQLWRSGLLQTPDGDVRPGLDPDLFRMDEDEDEELEDQEELEDEESPEFGEDFED